MVEGTVKWFSEKKGFGFIKPKSRGKDIFVHLKDVHNSGYDKLYENDFVEFEINTDNQGKTRAVNITAYESE